MRTKGNIMCLGEMEEFPSNPAVFDMLLQLSFEQLKFPLHNIVLKISSDKLPTCT